MAGSIRVKVVIFSVINQKLQLYLPAGRLPQAQISTTSSLNSIAIKIVQEVTGEKIDEGYLEQLYTFSHPVEHDTRVDIIYFYLLSDHDIRESHRESFIANEHLSKSVSEFSAISYAVQRLRWKIEYTNVVYSLLPREFTLSELQKIYEAILGKDLDKRNFRRKILSLGLLRSSGRQKTGLKARPAKMYSFRHRNPMMIKVF
ncbi:MAG: hypothetical protein UV73_C0005G0044 [Candidatus Gottesmanbacteria bacterium GW2011_GWA2_43_14]|uniref:NrtR DNA-binding winged helix domain-containing protein n=1 Tax=Candidatus Gottesmanbacteria bacterium GW2011_GWA2_43_14 TaxID=1618443 RepID=A0A0G1DJL9_9BACT|nr:MAG: hypothetical protein UV73_C0005G0044 [Candidatus Gottesmanbacteria bacterium GW2011_GWA2_43_14]